MAFFLLIKTVHCMSGRGLFFLFFSHALLSFVSVPREAEVLMWSTLETDKGLKSCHTIFPYTLYFLLYIKQMDYGRLNDDTKIIPLNHPFSPQTATLWDDRCYTLVREKSHFVCREKKKVFCVYFQRPLGPCWEQHRKAKDDVKSCFSRSNNFVGHWIMGI